MEYVQIKQRKYHISSNKSKLNYAYTFLVVFYPLLSMYRFGGTYLSIADACALLLVTLIVLRDIRSFRVNTLFLFLAMILVIHTCMISIFSTLDNGRMIDLIGTTLRLLLIYFVLSISEKYFIFEFGKKILILTAAVATFYLFIQYGLSFFGIYTGGGIPILNQYTFRDDVTGYINDVTKYGLIYRPRSFFEEPAHFCQYTIVAVTLLLFDQKGKAKLSRRIVTLCLLGAGILFSMSLLGWVALTVICFLYGIFLIKKKKYAVVFASCLGVLLIVFLILCNTEVIQNVIVSKFLDQSISSDSRFQGLNVFSTLEEQGVFYLLFGNGMLATDMYYNGISRIFISFGIFGFIVAFGIFLFGLRKHKSNQLAKALILLLTILNFGSEIIFGKFILVFLAFIHEKSEVNDGVKNEKIWLNYNTQGINHGAVL